MNLLRIITPKEIGDIATKHNGGKYFSLTDLVNERVEHKIYRDFSNPDTINDIETAQAKILPLIKTTSDGDDSIVVDEETILLKTDENQLDKAGIKKTVEVAVHKETENMSSFILIEKARLKRSQQILKQKEIIDLYQKNSDVNLEQIKSSNSNSAQASDAGILVNKKQY